MKGLLRKLRKFALLLGHPRYRRGLAHGVAAAIEHRNFLRSTPLRTLIDAGAHTGQFALAVRKEAPHAVVYAFEPLNGPAERFRALFKEDRAVHFAQLALGSVAGEAEMHLSRRLDSSSLLPIGELQRQVFAGTEMRGTERIAMVRLDDVADLRNMARPAVLKLDVQGFELEVLKGAQSLLSDIDGIYAELSFIPLYEGQPLASDVIAWLSGRDFEFAAVYNVTADRNGIPVQADIYFRRSPCAPA